MTIPHPTEAVLESISDGVFTVDLNWKITFFNRAAEEITGVERSEALGRHCSEVFRSSMCGAECALRQTLNTGRPIIGQSGYIINADGHRIPISISTALLKDSGGNIIGGAETFRDLSEIEGLRQELSGKFQIGDLTSRSPLMQRIFEILPPVAASSSTVLIGGETGTGKEVLARTIHSLSPRAGKPFIAVNCGALPDQLLESELFGYKAGAFTDARRNKPGRFALAEGGTLFLDEIGEISPAIQVKLLRVLQEHIYEPLGSVKSETADIRVITATNRNLIDLVAGGTFREDLFYRINIIQLQLPPLRNRKEDIPLLAGQFIQRFNQLQHKQISGISPEALSLLIAHRWPGNIRELENIIERAFILCGNQPIDLVHLPAELTAASQNSSGICLKSTRNLLEAQVILQALERNNYNRSATARYLGIHKTTLYRRLKSLGIKLPSKTTR